MGRVFSIPSYYRSSFISEIKSKRKIEDSKKKNFSPSILEFENVRFKVARHFGFCFGVQNAIEIAYKALRENPGKRVFLLSEMIHNPHVNRDLIDRGVKFILGTDGSQLIPFEELTPKDIVIVPAFGTTVELFRKLDSLGIDPRAYDATCPFVEKVWKRSEQLGRAGFSVIIHGKASHEETRATFSHARLESHSLVILDLDEAKLLARYIKRQLPEEKFFEDFADRYSSGFHPVLHLSRIGVVNQTTMLATETQAISDLLRDAMRSHYGEDRLSEHFADTRDTLCYATSENQDSVLEMIKGGGDLAIVVGGYNSSNTSHLYEICAKHLPTFYVKDAGEILERDTIRHWDFENKRLIETRQWLPEKKGGLEILLTAGASCPDAQVEEVIRRIASLC